MNATCYACDATPTGHTKHNGSVKPACKRHAGPSVKPPTAKCLYCGDAVRRGAVAVDGEYAHQRCHKEALSA